MRKLFTLAVVLLLIGASPSVAAEKTEPAASGENVYLKLPPITATIFREQLPAGTFTVAVTLQIDSEGSRTEILEDRRRLRDTMFRELHAMFEREEYTGRKVNVTAVKRRMLLVAQKQLGKDVVLDLFVNALSRRGA
ncbi:MAG: hypothetical protein HKN28_11440 [Alphaproteobacteria bacterium]|nr:hypothetical protein [Alphaproteobacteria bacterium]